MEGELNKETMTPPMLLFPERIALTPTSPALTLELVNLVLPLMFVVLLSCCPYAGV